MNTSRLMLGSAILALTMGMGTAPSLAQETDFGDNSSTFADNGRCDDPRFEGPGAAILRTPVDEGRDAADCEAAFAAGDVTLVEPSTEPAVDETDGDIDFGDDSGRWANDGECDDPRFGGLLESHLLTDATDCREAFEAGDVQYLGDAESPVDVPSSDISADDIDFGDDSGMFANDGECDDPRFGGVLDSHLLADATDCREALEAGDVTYSGEMTAEPTEPLSSGDIDFGNDDGIFANDGECDDPRFGGTLDSHRLADATDCLAAFEAGEVDYLGGNLAGGYPIVIDGIDFGDDSGNWAPDGECDDPRFTGPGVGVALDDHLYADATDCSEAYSAGTVTLADEDTDTSGSNGNDDFRINFGDDSSPSAFDGTCDDPRFQGRGAALELRQSNLLADATDCREALEAGTVTYTP